MSSRERESLAAWTALLQTHAFVVEALEREILAKRGLPLTWFEVLVRLADAPEGRLPMHDLARQAWLSKSGITRLVDRMESGGVVERRSCDHDRRVTYAAITPAGRRALRGAVPLHLEGIESTFSRHLSPEEQRTLRELLLKVLRANGQAAASCEATETALPARA